MLTRGGDGGARGGTVKGHRTLNLLQLALTDKEGRAGGDRAACAYQFLKLNLKPPWVLTFRFQITCSLGLLN